MSYTSEYLKLRKKREEEKKKSTTKTSSNKSSSGSFTNEYLALREKRMTELEQKSDDIAPVFLGTRTSPLSGKREAFTRYDYSGVRGNGKGGSGYFQKSDGNFLQTVGGTATDVAENAIKGRASWWEQLIDGLVSIGASASQTETMANANQVAGFQYLIGNDKKGDAILKTSKEVNNAVKQGALDFAEKDLINEEKIAKQIIDPVESKLGIDTEGRHSVLGDKSDALVQSGANHLAREGLKRIPYVGQALAIATTGATSLGAEFENAARQGATFEEAFSSGMVSAASEVGFEYAFGTIGFGGKGIFDGVADSLAKVIPKKFLATLAKWGINVVGEGLEEYATGWGQAAGQKMTYASEKEWKELYSSEEKWDNFVGGVVFGGLFEGVNFAKAKVGKADYVTGLTNNERKVLDKVYNDKVAEEQQSKGKKLTINEKTKIFDGVVEDMQHGQISTDTIEEVFGGETYNQYKTASEQRESLVNKRAELQKELAELENKSNTIGNAKRYDAIDGDIKDIDAQIKNIDKYPVISNLKQQLVRETLAQVKNDSRLVESYNEVARRREAFKVDLNQYTGKRRTAVERAVKSGVLNNTYRSHQLVDILSKIEEQKGIKFDYANNEKLKLSGLAVEGKTVNGFMNKSTGTVTLNVQSSKAWQSTVGHEITHILEGTEAYGELQSALFAYAKSKGELDSRKANLTELYKDLDADIDAELTADLVGDYLFTDSDFIKNLTGNRNLFQKVYDEIKYLCKVATGKELTEIEKVRREFDKAWQELSIEDIAENEATDAEIDDVKYSISVEDKSTLDALNEQVARGEYNAETNPNGGYYVTYKSMSYWGTDENGNAILRSPMAEYVDGELSNAYLIPKDKSKLNWYQATETLDEKTGLPSGLMVKVKKEGNKSFTYLPAAENQDLIKDDWSNLYFNLEKKVLKNGKWVKSDVPARYNPYEHSSNSMLNDQFSAAYLRDNLVTVKMYVPISEDNGAFRAKWSKDPTGWADWKTGTVAGKINKQKDLQRKVYLSRYAAPVEIVPDSEVAQAYKEYLDGTDVTIPDNVVSPNLLNELKKAGVPITESGKVKYSISEDSNGNELSLAVQKRFANSKAVDENGNLKVLYHGTYGGEFYTFDKSKGSVEGDFGSGFYFTDNEYDVEENYEGGGADFENKVARRAEQIEAEEEIDYNEAEARARKELYVGSHKHEVYVNIENPAIVGETNLFDYESYAEEYDREDYDSDEDYEADIEQLIADDIDQIIWDVDRNVDVYSTDGLAEVLWNAFNEGGIGIEQLKAQINNLYLEDSNGNLVGNEVTRQIIESLGYDGIVDNTVSTKFNMNLEEGTTHYIVFKPNQIKSITNQNPTDNPDIRYSISENKLDNEGDLVYNGKRGEGYVATDEFRNLQAECQGMSDEDIQLYHSGNKQIDDGLRERFSRSVKSVFLESKENGVGYDKGLLNLPAKNNNFNIHEGVDGSLFHDVFEMARNHLKYGELVDLHEIKTTEDGIGYNDCYNYLSDDGLSGFSITPDGDLISVFNASGKKGFLRAIAPIVKEKAKTLDCYASENQNLMEIYSAIFGFKSASVMDYNMEYDHDNIAENHGMPQIAFMVNAESDVETRQFTKDEYDEAVEYRNSFVNQAAENEAASFMPKDIAPVKNSLSFKGEQPSSIGTPLKDLYYEGIAPVKETAPTSADIPKADNVAPTVEITEDAPMPNEIAPMTEEEANAIQDEKVEAHSATSLEAIQAQIANLKEERNEAYARFEQKIAKKQAELKAKKNKETKVANKLVMQIEDLKRRRDSVDADYAKNIGKAETREKLVREGKPTTRQEHHNNIMNDVKATFSSSGYDFDDVLEKAKNLSTFSTVDNTPQRVMEKALGYKEGQILADLTVNKVAQNETEGIKWLNSFTDRKSGVLAQLSNEYKIKPYSDEDAAAMMYAEGFYVNDNNDIVAYGDAELAQDFPDANVRNRIKGLAQDPRFRKIYDETLDAINESRKRNAYPEIQKLDNYYLHFRAMDDTFSKLGLPFNPNDIRAKDLPTDLNGVTADLKPGQPYFSSAMHRKGKRTSFALLGGLERYLTSAKNQIYHIDDIQTLRALRNYIADTYGQANGLEGIDTLTEEEAQERIEQVYNSHLSTFAKFLNEEANVLAGKTALIDRGLEGVIGRRGMTFMDSVRKQVGSNMIGFNASSSLTNFLAGVQAIAKTNKAACVKSLAQTASSRIKSIFGNTDSFVENNPTIIRRKGAERFYRTPFQKVGDAGYVLMSAVDDVTTEFIVRAKYNEFIKKGMSEQQAITEADKWTSRLMGDRSLGQMPQIYNSKTLGLITQFQLEVRNQLDSQFYDTIQEAKASNEDIQNGLERNAKTAAKVTKTFFELAVLQHLFGAGFEAVAGYNPTFDIIGVLATALGFDDDDESEDTPLDNIEQGFLELLEDLPYTSLLTNGGRIPISSALPIKELVTGKDEYGNEKSRLDTIKETAPYYILPTGYGQIKKTSKGLSMFNTDEDHPIAGSYTDSGSLRFPVEDTLGNRIQAGIFGQYANENAREYFDNGYAPLKEKQIQEYMDVDMPIKDYWEYREGLKGLKTTEEKFDYIDSLDLPLSKKNILANHVTDRKEAVDLENYDDFSSLEEFDYATKNPEKYVFAKSVGGYDAYKSYSDELYDIKADKDENGKSISGSRKEKVIDYINNLDADYETKIILFKSEYPADDTYNVEIVNYINNREDLTYEERIAIFTELGFTVQGDTVYWD